MPIINLTSALHIHSLELSVNLGWRTQERKLEQSVLLDLDMHFAAPPKACQTDNLKDTVCYATLVNDIRTQLADKHYRLIEQLAADIYTIAKTHLPMDARLMIRLTKYPTIGGLTGGVSFQYGDA